MAEISKQVSFIVLDSADPDHRHVSVVNSLSGILRSWTAGTRFSPIHSLTSTSLDEQFRGEWILTFMGPVHPFDFARDNPAMQRAWCGIGLFNVVCATQDKKQSTHLRKWLDEQKIPSEAWTLGDGIITSVEVRRNVGPDISDLRDSVSVFPYEKTITALRPSLLGYLPLMAATISRAALTAPYFISDLEQFHQTIGRSLGDSGTELDLLEKLNLITVVNAGLSHFCSQTFSGISPILETECPYWSHSLLGVGLATLGLWKIKRFVENCFLKSAIPNRLEAFHTLSAIDVELPERDPAWKRDYLAEIPDSKLQSDQPVRSLAYFSGRDGFRSSRCTISAPLASIEACNSQKWNLLTMTHELSHVLTDGCLSVVCPNPANADELRQACELVRSSANCHTLLDSLKRLFLRGVISTHTFLNDGEKIGGERKFHVSPESLSEATLRTSRLISEIVTHIVDFKYFYESSSANYANSVWSSWGVLPRGHGRIHEYLLRTLCALVTNHLGREDKLNVVRAELEGDLAAVSTSEVNNEYIQQAIGLLKNEKSWEELKQHVVALAPIISLASTFFFSEKLAIPFSREVAVHSNSEREGYRLSPGTFDRERITNKIRFLLEYAAEVRTRTLRQLLGYCINSRSRRASMSKPLMSGGIYYTPVNWSGSASSNEVLRVASVLTFAKIAQTESIQLQYASREALLEHE